METFGQCIRAWMRVEDLNAVQLTKKLNYKSKTSVFRLLHGKSNYQSCVLFYRKVEGLLNAEWKNRFQKALLSEKIGMQRHSLLEKIDRCLFPFGTESVPIQCSFQPPFVGGNVIILGCPWRRTFSMLDEWLASSGNVKVVHYITRQSLFESDALLPGLISHMTSMRYSAIMLDDEDCRKIGLSWNVILWISEDRAGLIQISGEKMVWLLMPGGREQAQNILSPLEDLPKTSLYQFNQLQTGSDYIFFTEQNYKMEYNRKTLIIKPCPGMQMLPADIVERTFKDFLALNREPVSVAKESLIYTYEKRVKNFYNQKKPIYMMMSIDSLTKFAHTGVLDDHFYAFRPFTREERVELSLVPAFNWFYT